MLCLDGVEISTSGGHYVAIDMPASPYPLGGEARDVVEDVRRLGGFGIAAHPDSPKPRAALAATGMRRSTAIELLNPDTGWRLWAQQRQRRRRAMVRPATTAVGADRLSVPPGGGDREPDRPDAARRRDWEAVTRHRRLVAIAGADAHAKIAPRSADPGDSRYALPFPGYESSFRVLSIHVRPDRPLSGDAAARCAAC